jgi:hypothetical protein
MSDNNSVNVDIVQSMGVLDDDRGGQPASSVIAMSPVQEEVNDETDTRSPAAALPLSSPKSLSSNTPNDYDDNNTDNNNSNNNPIATTTSSSAAAPIIMHSPRTKKQKQRDKMQRRVPGSLDLDYITPRIIGMAPPRAKFGNIGKDDDSAAAAAKVKRQKRQRGNDPGELSTFLEKRHSRRYLLFNVSDEDADDRSLLLLGRQVVHLPWGSPKIPHPNDGTTTGQHQHHRRSSFDITPGSNTGDSINNPLNSKSSSSPSSGTPAISRVMDICYALHAYLSIPPTEIPDEQQQQKLKKKKGKLHTHHHHHHKEKPPSTVACIYCGNGKTRTGVIVACYLRFCNEVPDALSGFDIFCHRRGIMSSSSSNIDDISSHIPPSLRQFFSNFDELVSRMEYPHPRPLMLQSIQLQGVPVDDMPCVDIFEYGDVMKQQIYSSHDDTSLNEWDDEEGTYKIGQLLCQDFTLVCRFGGEFAGDDQDPSKVLFRYVNSPKFLSEGNFDLGMVNVDMMRRYADSFDEEDFLLTLVFESVDEDDGGSRSSRKKKMLFGASKFDGRVLEGIDLILEGWRVLSDAHLSRYPAETENDLNMDSTFTLNVLDTEIDFRPIALQLTNGDVGLARAELLNGMFGFLFNRGLQAPNLDETEHSRSDQKSYLSSEMSIVSNSATSQTDQSTSYQNDGDLHTDESSNLVADDIKTESTNEMEGKGNVADDVDAVDVHPDGTKIEQVPQTDKDSALKEDDKDVDLLCVMPCCGNVGVAVVGKGATKSSAVSKSDDTSIADSISLPGEQVADDTENDQQSVTLPDGSAEKESTIEYSTQCLADALTESIDSKTDEQLVASLEKDVQTVTIAEDYLKYCKMMKMVSLLFVSISL